MAPAPPTCFVFESVATIEYVAVAMDANVERSNRKNPVASDFAELLPPSFAGLVPLSVNISMVFRV